jgi:hypothetical protein
VATSNPSAHGIVSLRAALLVAREAAHRALATLGHHPTLLATVDNLVAQILDRDVASLPVVCVGTAPRDPADHARVLTRHLHELTPQLGGEPAREFLTLLRKILGALELGVSHA